MTTKIRVEMVESAGYPVTVHTVTPGGNPVAAHEGTLHKKGDSVEVWVHQNQDVVVGELKTSAA